MASEVQEQIRRKLEVRFQQNLRAANEEIRCVESLADFYTKRLFTPAWGAPQANQLVASLSKAGDEGLDPNDYHLAQLERLSQSVHPLSPLQKADLDLLLTDAFLLYSSHLLSGKVNPETIDPDWKVKRREGDPLAHLQLAIAEGAVSAAIKNCMPKHATYVGLKQALVQYKEIKIAGGWQEVSSGATLKEGDVDSRVMEVKRRLLSTKDLGANEIGKQNEFDEKLVEALVHFQQRHNLQADGAVGPETLAALNVSVENRIDQIKVNLERWRWLPQEFSAYYILVNIANFSVEVFKQGGLVSEHKAIVGRDVRRTPVFSSTVSYLVFNPTWTVPPGILNGDVIPGMQKDPNYLKKKNISVFDNNGNKVDPSTINWKGKGATAYTYVQPPGPDNALGSVKFMFPNSFSVYLHDTPSRDLFEKNERSFSSGCIRVQNPLDLAALLLNDPLKWSLSNMQQLVATQKTVTVSLKEQPKIHILYWTAWVNSVGSIQFRKDVYNRDVALINALGAK